MDRGYGYNSTAGKRYIHSKSLNIGLYSEDSSPEKIDLYTQYSSPQHRPIYTPVSSACTFRMMHDQYMLLTHDV